LGAVVLLCMGFPCGKRDGFRITWVLKERRSVGSLPPLETIAHALAFVGASPGYSLTLTMPETMSTGGHYGSTE